MNQGLAMFSMYELPDQRFIYALDFQNGAHLEVSENLSQTISDKGHGLIVITSKNKGGLL